MKRCNHCWDIKPYSEYYNQKGATDGCYYICKSCTTIRNKKYYQKNKNYMLRKTERWNKNNPERKKEIVRRWQHNHLKWFRKYMRKYRIGKYEITNSISE